VSWERIGCAVALAAMVSLSAPPRTAEAQLDPANLDTVQATPKGTIGLGLVGAELGLIIPSVSGLNEAWALSVFPIVGAAGGALAGYFALDKPGRDGSQRLRSTCEPKKSSARSKQPRRGRGSFDGRAPGSAPPYQG